MSGSPTLVSIPALYTDEIRALDPTGDYQLINLIPEDGETGIGLQPMLSLQLVNFAGVNFTGVEKVTVTRGLTGSTVVAVDMALGGVQPGYTGTAIYRTSVGSPSLDEFVVSIRPDVEFQSLEMITVLVEGEMLGFPDHIALSYTFQVNDYTAPAIESILWLTATRAMVVFNEVVDTDSAYCLYNKGNVSIETGGNISLRGQSAEISDVAVGMQINVRGSLSPANNINQAIVTKTAVGDSQSGYLRIMGNLGAGMVEDTGIDRDDHGVVVDRRQLRASISRIRFEPRLAEEGLTEPPASPRKIQVSYVPLVKAITPVDTSSLPPNVEAGRCFYVDVDEPPSLGRLYEIHWTAGDANGNWAESSLPFQMPSFGLTEAIDGSLGFWTPGMLSAADMEQDVREGTGTLRKFSAVLDDALMVQRYYGGMLTNLEEPAFCPDSFVDFLLYDRAVPFKFCQGDPKLGKMVAEFFPYILNRSRGTEMAIEDFIREVTDIPCKVVFFWTADHWILGDPVYSRLGHTTMLGPGTDYERNCWILTTYRDITDTEEEILNEICLWSDPWNLHFLGVVEPSDVSGGAPTPGTGYWILGTSILGSTTVLGG